MVRNSDFVSKYMILISRKKSRNPKKDFLKIIFKRITIDLITVGKIIAKAYLLPKKILEN